MTTAAGEAFLAERRAFRSTLEEVGPEARSLIGRWNAADIATHVLGGEEAAGVFVFPARLLVARGIDLRRFNSGGAVERATTRQRERMKARGFEWVLRRLEAPPPWLFLRSAVAPLSLFEVWVHHEDVRRANGRPRDPARDYPALRECFGFLDRYQRKGLRGATVVVDPEGDPVTLGSGPRRVTLHGPVSEAVLWLAGRHLAAEVEVDGDDDVAVAARLHL